MNIIVCIDNAKGILFNHRRQSQDRAVREYILRLTASRKLWMNTYSRKQFTEYEQCIIVDDEFLLKAEKGDYCFVEDEDISSYTKSIEKIILFKWNRRYPADTYFLINLNEWVLESTEDFTGHSHERITKEIYIK